MLAAISRIHYPIHALGPGRRLGIWFQGCSIRCAGCISTDTWAARTPDIDVDSLLSDLSIWIAACDGVTISGGEPFEQRYALHHLLTGLKAKRNVDVLVFSGRPLEALSPLLTEFDGLIDALVSDPFVASAGQTLALRGSDNQRLTTLTKIGEERFASYHRQRRQEDDRLDFMMDDEGSAWMAGIPRPGDLGRLQDLLATNGHRCRTTEAPTPVS